MKEMLTALGVIAGIVFFGFQLATPMMMQRKLKRIATHPLLDRFASASAFGLIVSRRLFVRTTPAISRSWRNAAETLLREAFG